MSSRRGIIEDYDIFLVINEDKIQNQFHKPYCYCHRFFHEYQFPTHLNPAMPYIIQQSMKLNEYNASTSVYLQQITNHIQLGEGYNHLRKHLFRELHQLNNGQIVSDDKLYNQVYLRSESIVSYLAGALNKTVNFHRSTQTFRILQIIEDLLTYAEEVMSPAMHTELFVSALVHTANPKIITFDSKTDADCRQHAMGILLFWFDRYGREEQCNFQLFIKGFQELKEKKLLFPNEITIKPSDFFKRQLEDEKNAPKPAETNESKTNRIILEDIQGFTVKTQSLFKENFKAIATTEYVRLIKHKSKTLFEFTSKPNDFTEKEKNLVKDLYKRLRVILKELDKYKETSLQTKKSEKTEKQYVEAKMTPKKSPAIQHSPLAEKVQATPQKKIIQVKNEHKSPSMSQSMDLLDMGPVLKMSSSPQKKISPIMANSTRSEQVYNVDLLGDNTKLNLPIQQQEQFVEAIVVTNTENQKKAKQQAALFQVFSTPKKQVHEEDGIMLAKASSSNSQDQSPGFQNEKMAKNPYSFIPGDLNLTPTSSVEDEQQRVKDKPIFSLFGLFNANKTNSASPETFQQQNLPYDSIHKKGKKFSQITHKNQPQVIINESLKAVQLKNIVSSPNYKPVAPVNYETYAQFISQSPQKQDQQSKFELTPKKPDNKQLKQIQFCSPKSGEKIKQVEQ